MADGSGGNAAARAAQAARAAAANAPRTSYDRLIQTLNFTGISWLAGWAGWSLRNPREAAAILAGKLSGPTDWERLAKESFTYEEDPLTTAMLKQTVDGEMQRLANDRKVAGMAARASDGNLAIYAFSYQKKYKNGNLTPADVHLLVCATIENLRLNAIKEDLKGRVLIKSRNLTDRESRALAANTNSRTAFPGFMFNTPVDTRPPALREFVKTALIMSADDYPELRLAEIFDFDAVRGLVRENAQIPPIRNEDGASAFVARFCTTAPSGPERLDQAARAEIAAGAAGGGANAGGRAATNFSGLAALRARLEPPRAAGATVGRPPRLASFPAPAAAEEEDEAEEGEVDEAGRPAQPGAVKRARRPGQGGGYRRTRRNKNKNKRKTRSSRKSKNKSRSSRKTRSRSRRG